jgi:hypothetical protein
MKSYRLIWNRNIVLMWFDKWKCIFEKYIWIVVDMLNTNFEIIRLLNFRKQIDLFDHTYVRVVYHYWDFHVLFTLSWRYDMIYLYMISENVSNIIKIILLKIITCHTEGLIEVLSHTNLFMYYRDLILEEDWRCFFVNEVLDLCFEQLYPYCTWRLFLFGDFT